MAFVIVHSARKNSFQQVRKVQMETTTIPDFSSGSTIRTYSPGVEQPSMMAASSSSFGIPDINPCRIVTA